MSKICPIDILLNHQKFAVNATFLLVSRTARKWGTIRHMLSIDSFVHIKHIRHFRYQENDSYLMIHE